MVLDLQKKEIEKAVLVGLARSSKERLEVEESLNELAELAFSAKAEIIGKKIQVKQRPNPALYVGTGFVEQIKEMLEKLEGNTVIFDDTLSPAQQRNLEKALECKVIDRPILILDIFATRARTAGSRLQVELAQLEYTLPRLTGAWLHFSRQYGGIGAKGPGETQLEIDRRQVRTKISQLKNRLKKLDVQRTTQRKRRQNLYKVALVGYTNAGKSTLFNILTKSEVRTKNMLFTTLDSTTRVMSTGYPSVTVFSDTVGFIKKLPHQLVESFKSTLEEVALANLLIHVVDCSEENYAERIMHTREILKEIGAEKVPYLLVFNKIDKTPEFIADTELSEKLFNISASKKIGIKQLQAEIILQSDNFSKKNSSNC